MGFSMRKSLIASITEQNFDELTFDSSVPVMVFFGSKRCNVCKELFPIIQDISADYAQEMNIYWVDVDKYKPLFQRFRLRGIPNLLLFNNGEVREKIGGLHPKEVLVEVISKVLQADSLADIAYDDELPHTACLACLPNREN
jgi:thioredoxin 1